MTMESSWFCTSCCRERIERQRLRDELIDQLATAIQYKSPSLQLIQGILKSCPDIVKERDVFDNLPIHTACSNGTASHQLITCLVEAWPASLQTVGSEQDYALHLVCVTQANLEIVRYLAETWPAALLAPNKRHARPLHLTCARQPGIEVIEYLVQAGPQALKTKDKNRDTPLHVACSHKASTDVIKCLLQANPSTLQTRNRRGDLPLHAAAGARASIEVIQLLVQAHPAAVITANYRGDCALHAAAATAAPERVVAYLMDKALAILRQANHGGQLPLHLAAAAMTTKPMVLKQMIQKAPDTLGVADAAGNLPLHAACEAENASTSLSCILVLLNALPEAIRSPNRKGNLPLHVACSAQKVSFELVHYLMEMWNRPNNNNIAESQDLLLSSEKYARGATVTNRQGDTALHLACFHNAPVRVIELLVTSWPGALLVRNKAGLTPMQRAEHPSRGVPCKKSLQYMTKLLSKRLFALLGQQEREREQQQQDQSETTVQLKRLLEAHPPVAQERNSENVFPIHYVLHQELPCLQAVKLLVQAWPDCLQQGDVKTADRPLHLACRRLPAVDHVHYEQANQIVLFLIHKFKADYRNAAGQIALHTLCTNPHATSAAIQALVCAWPESVLQVDPLTALFPWQLAQEMKLPVSIVRWLHDRTEGLSK